MTATMRCSSPADDWAWLACTEPGCRWSGPVDRPDRLRSHTTTAHDRGPSVGERTPVVPLVRSLAGAPADEVFVRVARRLVDPDGRVWCCVFGVHYGLTRHLGSWWYARRPAPGAPIRFMSEITHPTTLTALDRWDLATVLADTDPTPAHMPRVLALAGGS